MEIARSSTAAVADVLGYTKGTFGQRLGVYLRTRWLPPSHPRVPPLLDYAYRVLDAVGIRNGGAHAAIMFTADGPQPIEVAARISGTRLQALARYASGECQIDRAVRHVLDSEFTPDYRQLRHASWPCCAHRGPTCCATGSCWTSCARCPPCRPPPYRTAPSSCH